MVQDFFHQQYFWWWRETPAIQKNASQSLWLVGLKLPISTRRMSSMNRSPKAISIVSKRPAWIHVKVQILHLPIIFADYVFITDHPKFCKTPQFLFKTLAIPNLSYDFLWFPLNFPNKNPEVSPVTHSTLETRGQNPSTLLAAAAHLATDEAATAPRLHGLNGCWTKNRGKNPKMDG